MIMMIIMIMIIMIMISMIMIIMIMIIMIIIIMIIIIIIITLQVVNSRVLDPKHGTNRETGDFSLTSQIFILQIQRRRCHQLHAGCVFHMLGTVKDSGKLQ